MSTIDSAADERELDAAYDTCMGAGMCAAIAPTYFDVVDGTVTLLRTRVSAADVPDVDEAVDGCPTQALRFGAGG